MCIGNNFAMYEMVLTIMTVVERFEILEKKALAPLMESRSINQTLRIWVPGCSTGEEAYTIAIIILRYMILITECVY